MKNIFNFAKTVLAFKPDWRAMLMKLTPISFVGALDNCGDAAKESLGAGACIRSGSAKARTSLNGSTSALRHSEWMNLRRVEANRNNPFPEECRARIRRFLL